MPHLNFYQQFIMRFLKQFFCKKYLNAVTHGTVYVYFVSLNKRYLFKLTYFDDYKVE